MKLITVARDLHRRRARERTGLFLAEGVRTVEELLASSISIAGIVTSPALGATERGAELGRQLLRGSATRGYELLDVSDDELATAAGTEAPQGVIAIGTQPERSFEKVEQNVPFRAVVLDGVQDPGNVGTILRTAEAFGVAATVALGGTVDLWNPKVVRASMGALFRQHAFSADPETLVEYCRVQRVELWATSAGGEPLRSDMGRATDNGAPNGAPERLAIVVGNEGSGVSGALSRAAHRTVAIPIRGIESLNVAVATGILLYTLSASKKE